MTRPRSAGFTLVELLLSLSLVALLLVALVDAVQGFGGQLEAVEAAEADWRVEESAALVSRAVRHAWLVEEVQPDELTVTDSYGGKTVFKRSGGDLLVQRPSGAQGVLTDGLAGFAVDTSTMQRLRTSTEAVVNGPWWSDAVADVAATAVSVEESMPVSLGFTLPADAPDSMDVVSGVEEQALSAALDTLALSVAFVVPVSDADGGGSVGGSSGSAPDAGDGSGFLGFGAPGVPVPGEDVSGFRPGDCGDRCTKCGKKWCKGDCDEGGGGGTTKVTVCHVPPGNPAKAHTISVGEPALSAHLAHGDLEGNCVPADPLPDPLDSTLTIALYEARAPDDGRPHGAALASVDFPVKGLPTGSGSWVAASSLGAGWTVVCHFAPAEASDYVTCAVRTDELTDHLAHGDVVGSCDDGTLAADTPVLMHSTPVSSTSFDLSALGAQVEPGRAYALELSVSGRGAVLLRGESLGASTLSGVAGDRDVDGMTTGLPLGIARGLSGDVSYSQTTSYDVVSQVAFTLTPASGTPVSRTSSVLSQVGAPNPWLGAVPGELPALDLSGH